LVEEEERDDEELKIEELYHVFGQELYEELDTRLDEMLDKIPDLGEESR